MESIKEAKDLITGLGKLEYKLTQACKYISGLTVIDNLSEKERALYLLIGYDSYAKEHETIIEEPKKAFETIEELINQNLEWLSEHPKVELIKNGKPYDASAPLLGCLKKFKSLERSYIKSRNQGLLPKKLTEICGQLIPITKVLTVYLQTIAEQLKTIPNPYRHEILLEYFARSSGSTSTPVNYLDKTLN